MLISQRQNIYREKGKPSVVHPLSSSSSTVFLVECRRAKPEYRRKILSEQRRESTTNSTVLAHKESACAIWRVIKWKSSVSWVEPCVYVALRWFIFQYIRLLSILWYSNPHAYLTVLAFLVYAEVGTPPSCTHITTKSCAPPLPMLIFWLLTCQLEKTNIEAQKILTTSVPTNVTSIVVKAARTDLYACWLRFWIAFSAGTI